MKRRELIKRLEEMGCVLVRHGARHDWYTNPKTKQRPPPTVETVVWHSQNPLKRVDAMGRSAFQRTFRTSR